MGNNREAEDGQSAAQLDDNDGMDDIDDIDDYRRAFDDIHDPFMDSLVQSNQSNQSVLDDDSYHQSPNQSISD